MINQREMHKLRWYILRYVQQAQNDSKICKLTNDKKFCDCMGIIKLFRSQGKCKLMMKSISHCASEESKSFVSRTKAM